MTQAQPMETTSPINLDNPSGTEAAQWLEWLTLRLDAMTWQEIAEMHGVTRQAAHGKVRRWLRRLADAARTLGKQSEWSVDDVEPLGVEPIKGGAAEQLNAMLPGSWQVYQFENASQVAAFRRIGLNNKTIRYRKLPNFCVLVIKRANTGD